MIIQIDLGSAQQVSGPKILLCAHQIQNRIITPNKNNNIAIIDNLDLRKIFVKIDGIRDLRDSIIIKYEENDYIDQYRDPKLFYKEYVAEELLNPFIFFPDMKTKCSIDKIDLRHQADHTTSKKFNSFGNMVLIPPMLDCF